MDSKDRLSRRAALGRVAAVPAVAFGLAAAAALPAEAAKMSQKAAKYQNHPKGSAKCDNCRFFIEPKGKSKDGACRIVEGKISPNGWCVAYAKK